MNGVLKALRKDLLSNANEEYRVSGERFFREDVKILGVKTAYVGSIGKSHFLRLEDKEKSTVFSLCENLFQSGIMEESFVACNWSYNIRKQYEPSDFLVFERWVNLYVSNWATCDTLCNHTIGALIEMYPELLKDLINWTRSGNRWVKRASAVSLILPARRGKFGNEIFEIAGSLMHDGDDMVQKGYGWMLKVFSQTYPDEVFGYVMKNRTVMPRTALRYAIEKLPKEMKQEAMKRS